MCRKVKVFTILLHGLAMNRHIYIFIKKKISQYWYNQNYNKIQIQPRKIFLRYYFKIGWRLIFSKNVWLLNSKTVFAHYSELEQH